MGTHGSYEKILSSTSRSTRDLVSDSPDGSYSLFHSGPASWKEDQPSPVSLSEWIHHPEASPSCVELLMRNLEMVPSAETVLLIGSPAGIGNEHAYAAASSSGTPRSYLEFLSENPEKVPLGKPEMFGLSTASSHAYEAVSETGRKMWLNDAPKPRSSLNVGDFSERRSGKSIASACAVKNIGHEASATVMNQKPCYGGEYMNRSTTSNVGIGRHAKKSLLWGSEEDRKDYSPFHPHPDHETSTPAYLRSRPHSSEADRKECNGLPLHRDGSGATTVRQRDIAQSAERLRRLRVSESLKALQGLLPNSSSLKGGQTSIVDEIIDYVKYLQFQLKELCRSRLRSEPTASPFVFIEGYGHYTLTGQMMNESFEDVIGELLETNPSAATQLLAAKGLYLVPQSLVGGSPRTA